MWDWIAMHPAGSLALVAVLLILAFLLLGWLLLPYANSVLPDQVPEQPNRIWIAPPPIPHESCDPAREIRDGGLHKTPWKDRRPADRRKS